MTYTPPAKIEPWIELAVWEIDSRCLETGAFFNRNQAANIIAAHAPKETGIKPDTAQAARHEPTMTGSAQVRCPSCNEWVKLIWHPEPNVPGLATLHAQAARHEPGEFPIMPNKAYAANMQNKEYEPSVPVSETEAEREMFFRETWNNALNAGIALLVDLRYKEGDKP